MKTMKTIMIFLTFIFLAASTVYLAVIIRDENTKTGAIQTRASEPSPAQANDLLAYNSTSPGPSPTKSATNPLPTKAISPTVIPTYAFAAISATPIPVGGDKGGYVAPSPVPTLIESGLAEDLSKWMIVGGAFVMLAFAF